MEKLCEECGKPISMYGIRFCSKSCRAKWQFRTLGNPSHRADVRAKISATRLLKYNWKSHWSEDEARKLFEEYKVFKGNINQFGKEKHRGSLFRVFRTFFPDEYEQVVEHKMNFARLYVIGRHFEYRVRDYLKKYGYLVTRSAQSRGVFDLVAIKKGEALLVQCKTNGLMSPRDRTELIEIAQSVGAISILASRGEAPEFKIILERLKPNALASKPWSSREDFYEKFNVQEAKTQ